MSNLWALIGAATFLARFMALSKSAQTLFMPTMKITFLGPWAMQETRLELPSILTMTPSLVMALALDRKISASYAAISPALASILERSI